ncbi:sugar phosphate nucleotidyltransferase [Calditrichota bacterium]
MELTTIIMAGGKGKRMKSDLPKVLHTLNGKPLVQHVIELSRKVGSTRILLVVGHKRELVIEATRDLDVEWAIQEQQLGTGDAIKSCKEQLRGFSGDVLVLSGDVPLLKEQTINEAAALHKERQAAATVLTFMPDEVTGYGRIIRDENDDVIKVVEEKDASKKEKLVGEANGGIYLFKSEALFEALDRLSNDNASGEYYLTDTIGFFVNDNLRVAGYVVADPLELSGVNSRKQLDEMEAQLKARQVKQKA